MYLNLTGKAPAMRELLTKIFLVMKVTAFIFFITCLHVSATSFSQKVTLSVKEASLQSIFPEITRQTGISIFYEEETIRKTTPVTLKVKDMDIRQVLLMCVKNQPISFIMDEHNITIQRAAANRLPAPMVLPVADTTIQVTGTVTGEKGMVLPGATVLVKNTTQGASTSVDGKFSVKAKATDSLVIKFIGYQTQVLAIGSRRVFNISLVPAEGEGLNEVVVVGMNFRQTKRSVTGAMSTIQTKELKQSPVANLNNALAGRLPGLITVQSSGQPGEDAAAMYIRGIATYGNTAPLVVIDGLPRGQGSFSQIDPNEVESVSILKDASSSALYGIQGANGVIVVTTKRGKADQKPAIDFTAQQGVQEVIRLPQIMNTYESALYFNDYDRNNGLDPRFSEAALQVVKDGSDPYLYPDVNWFDEVLKKSAVQNQYNLNISGSSNKVRYFVSGSYIRQGSLLKHEELFKKNYGKESNFNRYNFRSNIDIQATSRLQVQVDLAGRLEQRVGPMPSFGEVFNQISNIPSFALPVFNPDGTLGAASNVEIPYWRNPYGLITQSGYYVNSTNVMYGTISAKHELDFITPGLSAQAFFSFENNNYNSTTRSQEFDAFWYKGLDIDGVPSYVKTRTATTLVTGGTNNIERSTYLDARLNYTRNWNQHAITAQVLANRTLRVYNYDLPFAYQGVSGRFTYGYKSRYFMEANLGYNGSENFPGGNRYGFFPSASVGWVASEESFLKDVSWLSYLKIRGSYGLVGNDKIGGLRWLYLSDFAPGDGYSFGINPAYKGGYNEARVGNPFVTWEHSQKANLGLEFSVLKHDVLQLTFDVFHERRTDILTDPKRVADYLGINGLAPLNSGTVVNKGLDGELRFNKRWHELSIFANLQLTYARNKVLQNDQPTPAYGYQDLRGYEVGYVLGYRAIGFFTSEDDIKNSAVQSFDNKVIPGDIKYMDVNSDGVIDAFDRVPIQIQNVPRYMGGFSAGASYKGVDISFLFNGSAGGTADYVPRDNNKILLQRWTPENQENAKVPVAKLSPNNSLTSDFYTFKTDYLKLRNAEIGYVIPQSFLNRIKVSYARIFINGQNLAIWDKLWIKDRDPESSGSWNTPYPLQRVYNMGINIKL
ncbi:TonB-dependent receptor [Chitinophaga defluvii]|uniref:TonB-dependent receptor n=1 Tax=Chitinophaga defluvii TaxID=3163343 RepID=A0ABV2T381_9BACT